MDSVNRAIFSIAFKRVIRDQHVELSSDEFFLLKHAISCECSMKRSQKFPERFNDLSFVGGYNPGGSFQTFLASIDLSSMGLYPSGRRLFLENGEPDYIEFNGPEITIHQASL